MPITLQASTRRVTTAIPSSWPGSASASASSSAFSIWSWERNKAEHVIGALGGGGGEEGVLESGREMDVAKREKPREGIGGRGRQGGGAETQTWLWGSRTVQPLPREKAVGWDGCSLDAGQRASLQPPAVISYIHCLGSQQLPHCWLYFRGGIQSSDLLHLVNIAVQVPARADAILVRNTPGLEAILPFWPKAKQYHLKGPEGGLWPASHYPSLEQIFSSVVFVTKWEEER